MKAKKNNSHFLFMLCIVSLITLSCDTLEKDSITDPVVEQFGYTNVVGTDYIIDVPKYNYSGIVNAVDLFDPETKVKASKISFKYLISVFFGEPTRSGIFMSQGNTGEAMIFSINIRTKVLYSDGRFTGFYYDYLPGVSTKDATWGWDTTGSPNWDKVFNNGNGVYATSTQAKDLFKAGFYLDALQILSINGISK
jgi:hypothetical protein